MAETEAEEDGEAACARSGFGRWSHGGMSATSETRPMNSTKSSAGVSQLHSGHTATFRLHARAQLRVCSTGTRIRVQQRENTRTLELHENAVGQATFLSSRAVRAAREATT